MTRVLSIDPGEATGIVKASWLTHEPIKIEGKWEVAGGLLGLHEWLTQNWVLSLDEFDVVVFEKFRIGPRVYRSIELEPLRLEGYVLDWTSAYDVDLVWQYNGSMLIGGTHGSAAVNKKAADDVLRELGLWTTGKEVNYKDANDVNSAMKHLVHYALATNHVPTTEEVQRINNAV